MPTSHNIINVFLGFLSVHQSHYHTLVEQEADFMLVNLPHSPAVCLLKPLVIEQDILIRGQIYCSVPAWAFGSFTSLAKVWD